MPDDRARLKTAPATTYYYRRPLSMQELAPAFGAAIGIGAAAFYLVRLYLQKTPLVRERGVARLDERGALTRRPERAIAPGVRAGATHPTKRKV